MPEEDLIDSVSACMLEMGFDEADDDVIRAIAEALLSVSLVADGEKP